MYWKHEIPTERSSRGESSRRGDVLAIEGAKVTDLSLELDPDLSEPEWEALVARLARIERGSRFFLGDAIVKGGRRYGRTYAHVVKQTSYHRDSLRNIASVCRRVPAEVRRADLEFAHHEAVAKLHPDSAAQALWLARAAEAEPQWSARRLQRELESAGLGGRRRGRVGKGAPPSLKRGAPCPTCGQPW